MKTLIINVSLKGSNWIWINWDHPLKNYIFQNVCTGVLDKYASENLKYVKANQSNFMDAELNQEDM